MNIDQAAMVLGPDSALLKEIHRLQVMYTGNLEQVKAEADQHTRLVLDALQAASDTAAAVKEAVAEAALRQQDEMLAMAERAAPPPPPPAPPSALLRLPANT
ncbi:hypothetical protein TSOC_011245 [Tetrabaena socialis]|uniref:Uncharacterized protein n=1 Tax=Tetrabaena socialis TaxID=47790 RepID=A0A2J7ZR41_9CHLO|nr:hypothetical protein TSOC_011245 [Tetrabaena socialis]|eukprot:PNH02739.1 hypothetical protein TSOC_011245 [Tetrabaena socialis]